ncbi:MAG: radical SAM protein [bacterium]
MNARKIVLVHPFSGDWERMRSAPFYPLNLVHAAACVARHHPVEIVDLRRESDWRARLRQAFEEPVLLVGITSMSGTMLASALDVARFVRGLAPVPVVWGGMHPTLLPEQTAAHPLVDGVVVADGENILTDLAERLASGAPIAGVPGTVCRDGERVVRGPEAALPDLDELPEPHFEMVPVRSYMPLWDGAPTLSLESARGCPRPCTFCYNTALNAGRFRMLSAERTIARVERLVRRHAPGCVYFVDDNFFLDVPRALAIGEGIARTGVAWQVQGADIPSLARLDDGHLRALAATGLKRISIGIESGSPRIRKRMKKSAAVDRVKREVARFAQHPIVLYCSFFVGSPTETVEDVKDTIALVLELQELNPHFRNSPFYSYLPLPGTEMLEDAVSSGHTPPSTLEAWSHLTFDMESAIGGATSPGTLTRAQAKALYFVTSCVDRKSQDYGLPRMAAALMELYRPIARWRLKHFRLGGMIELFGYRLVHAAWMASEAVRRRRSGTTQDEVAPALVAAQPAS